MKTLLRFLLGLVVLLVLVIVVMSIFRICPPPGPWPMPPWCDNVQSTSKNQDADSSKSIMEDLGRKTKTVIESKINITTSKDIDVTYTPSQDYLTLFSSPPWKQESEIKSRYSVGHTFMDLYNTNVFQNHLDTSLKSMKNNKAQWVVFDNYWSYKSIDPVILTPLSKRDRISFRDATEDELSQMIKKTHDNGMKFALSLELNWDEIRGEWQGWEHNQRVWEESQRLLAKKAKELDNPTPAINDYWDKWFEEYTRFVLQHANIAEKYRADMLVIGKQLDGAVVQGNKDRWKKLIQEVRKVYHGPLSYAAYTHNTYSQIDDAPFAGELDLLMIYMYNEISTAEQPTINELKASFNTILTKQAERFYKKYNKKIILLTPFQSRDYGAKQEWFEPVAPAPQVKQDLLIQAKMYEALFQALEGKDWIEGVWTWGYWWLEKDFNRDTGDKASFEKSSSVRNKPSIEIIKKWSIQ